MGILKEASEMFALEPTVDDEGKVKFPLPEYAYDMRPDVEFPMRKAPDA